MIRCLAPMPDSAEAWDALSELFPTALALNEVVAEDGPMIAVYFDDDDALAATENAWVEAVEDSK